MTPLSWQEIVLRVTLGLTTAGLGLLLFRRVARQAPMRFRSAVLVLAFGGVAAVVAAFAERAALEYSGLSLKSEGRAVFSPLLVMLLLCAPLEEALKALVVWPLYLSRRLSSGRVGAVSASLAAAGFAAVEVGLQPWVFEETGALALLRGALSIPAHLFFAGLWGYMLGGEERDRFFGVTWLLATFLHGVYDHIVHGRGVSLLVVVVPMLLLMVLFVVGLLREPQAESMRPTVLSLWEPPSFGAVREVLTRRGRPLKLQWIVLGAFVTVGVTLVSLGLGVYLGHRLGVDFALADEAGVEGMVPIGLLGFSLLAAFPTSAYLVARASGTTSVLEPAWAAGMAIVAVVVLFSVTEPTALAIALGVAPVGFALSCVGAWFGLDR